MVEVLILSNVQFPAKYNTVYEATRKKMAKSKKQNKSLETDSKETDIYELPDKEFKITLF